MSKHNTDKQNEGKGLVFDIQYYSIHDGPGIRTTVFFKKCPLRCIWCANPESMKGIPELAHSETKCVRCYRCLNSCPHKAISIEKEEDFPKFDRTICEDCVERRCVEACREGALEIIGKYRTVDEVFADAEKDSPFYSNSGGGVTLSGGEPTSQPGFCISLLKKLEERGIHTVLDTCGFVDSKVLKEIIEYVDLIYYDIKQIDTNKHKELTGVSNELILRNAKLISENNIPLIFRIPVIPGYNDSDEEMEGIARFGEELEVTEAILLPFHAMGSSKYKRLGMKYLCEDLKAPEEEQLAHIAKAFEYHGINCSY